MQPYGYTTQAYRYATQVDKDSLWQYNYQRI